MAVVGAALFALRLKLSEPASHALLFGRWGLPVGSLVGFCLALPIGQIAAVLPDDLGCLFESSYKYLCVGAAVVLYTVLPQSISAEQLQKAFRTAMDVFRAEYAEPAVSIPIELETQRQAQIMAKELEFALTIRTISEDKRVPMCGFPAFRMDDYIGKLNEKGFTVGVMTRDENGDYNENYQYYQKQINHKFYDN